MVKPPPLKIMYFEVMQIKRSEVIAITNKDLIIRKRKT